ncbi:DNA polymerase III subunit gamma and tau [Calidifontibacter terrae]
MSTALYRRYRPETFAEVIGQEHVTEPLMQALRTGRVNHAYLFSGPRGCGKTTSARILARCLNCEQGPTPTPCGTCESCVALARGGSGTVDVIEIDAASHGGVDDARDLRERASYGPAQSRFKIYIIDEAHMVTPQGFNALLKIVEEPPEHVKFIFATTEPEKVIGTIRSRTHHYPFRLVPPARLADYLQQLCGSEGVPVEPGVLSLVTRAGGGSVRDSLSVLDQLIAGSTDVGLTYSGATALLGFTDTALLDATVDAFAAGDSASVFTQIDHVVESGQDPRRFVEDLLERLRDLIVVAAVQDGAARVLRGLPEDQLERMRAQAGAFGPGGLTHAADIINAGLTEMTGATSPRLQLELMAARALLPRAMGEEGYAARLDRVERRLDISSGVPAGRMPVAVQQVQVESVQTGPVGSAPVKAEQVMGEQVQAAPVNAEPPTAEPPTAEPPTAEPLEAAPAQPEPAPAAPERVSTAAVPAPEHVSAAPVPEPEVSRDAEPPPEDEPAPEPVDDPRPIAEPRPAPQSQPVPQPPAPAPTRGGISVDAIRQEWPDILRRIAAKRRVTWTLISQHAHVASYDGSVLVLTSNHPGLVERISSDPNPDIVRSAVHDALGIDVRVQARLGDGGAAAPSEQRESAPSTGWGPGVERPKVQKADDQTQQAALRSRWQQRVQRAGGDSVAPAEPRPGGAAGRPTTGAADLDAQAAMSRVQRDDSAGDWGSNASAAPDWATAEFAPRSPAATEPVDESPVESMDDEDVDDAGEVGLPVMTAVLGATVIEDRRDL